MGEDDGQPFLVMRFMPGGSLADLLAFGRLNLADSARITERLGSALDTAHARGLVHRDLKPANILFSASGDAFLSDFGIVKMFEGDATQINMTGSVILGTPAYMSPEQALGKDIDKRSDVYSLGAVIYEMLTGVPPYKGPSSVSVAMKHVMDPVPHVREYRADIPDTLDAIVTRAMAKDPADRPASASALADEFASAVHALPGATQIGGGASAVSRKSITEAGARISSGRMPRDAGNMPSVSGVSDTQLARRSRWLVWLGIAAGVLAFIGLAMALVANFLGVEPPLSPAPTAVLVIPPPSGAPPGTPAPDAPAVIPAGPAATLQATLTSAPSTTPVPRAQIITVGGGNVRIGPGVVYPLAAVLPRGTELQAVAIARRVTDNFMWYEVILPDNSRGFVREDVVTINSKPSFDVLPDALNVPPTPLPTATATHTPSATPTNTPTPTPTRTVPPPPSVTPIPLASPTPLPATNTAPPTSTPLPATNTPSPTDTPAPPTATTAPTVTPTP